MVLSRTPIDFSTFPTSDGEPVAENRANLTQMTNLIYTLEQYLAPRVRFAVGGNQFIYYNRHDGWQHVAPDVYAALDVEPGMRPKWQTWEEGDRFPDVVFEITSESTQQEDLGHKVALYARLGAREYYIYDPQQVLAPPLRAYQRAGTVLTRRDLLPGPAIYSPTLGAELRVVGPWLRLIDPSTGEPVRVPEEEHEALLAAEARLAQEAQARLSAEERAATAQQQVQQQVQARLSAEERAAMAQQQVQQQVQARLSAEERAAAAEARAAAAEERARLAQQALLDAQAARDRPSDNL